MGTDISSYKGFVLSLSDLISLIEPAHLEGIRHGVAGLFYKRLDGKEIEASLAQVISSLKTAISSDDISESIHSIFAEEDFDDYGAEIDRHDQRFVLVSIFCEILLPITPKEIRIFARPRVEGFEVPTGEVVLVFDYQNCFEIRMTDTGKSVARALGVAKISPSHWTIMTY